jgi:hypothetical protein
VDEGSHTDHDEKKPRKMSVTTSACGGMGASKINILDTPGFSMFVHEAKMVLPGGRGDRCGRWRCRREVVTQRLELLRRVQDAAAIVVNRMDRPPS